MTKISTPRDLLIEELKDLYSAEHQLLKALPDMADAAASDELRAAFQAHCEQTETHIDRLQKIGVRLGESLSGKKCKAMAGLVAEGEDIIDEDADPAMRDLALIGAAQKSEHYEIAGYGTTRTLAELAGESEIADILQETLNDEGAADKLLTKIASELDLGSEDAPTDDYQPLGKGVGKAATLKRAGAEMRPMASALAATVPTVPVGKRVLGGQPENDQDARTAGLESATSDVAPKPEKPARDQVRRKSNDGRN